MMQSIAIYLENLEGKDFFILIPMGILAMVIILLKKKKIIRKK